MRCFVACLFLLFVAINDGVAQEVKDPFSNRNQYKNVFTPAANTVFSEDFSIYKPGDMPGKKWVQARGVMTGDEAINAQKKIVKAFCVWGAIWGMMKPDIPKNAVAGKYVTFECDFDLEEHTTLIVDLPDATGCNHYFSINTDGWTQHEPCRDTNTVYFRGTFNRSYPVRFDTCQWHCLAISFSEKEMRFYMDGYFFWGLGNNDEVKWGAYQYMYSGRMPSSFSINPSAPRGFAPVIGLRHVRFAQSDSAPKPERVSIAQFNKILTGEKFVTQDIHFEVNKADIKDESLPYLEALAGWLKQNPTIKLEIAGHTDSDGDDAANVVLSQQRADAIVNKLTSSGIIANRLKGVGYGESKPAKPNTTEAGKATNRRVEFRKL